MRDLMVSNGMALNQHSFNRIAEVINTSWENREMLTGLATILDVAFAVESLS